MEKRGRKGKRGIGFGMIGKVMLVVAVLSVMTASTAKAQWLFGNNGSDIYSNNGKVGIGTTGPVSQLSFSYTDNVDIGSTNPDSHYKLSVASPIRVTEVEVRAGWSDYTFNNDYKLTPLINWEQTKKELKQTKDELNWDLERERAKEEGRWQQLMQESWDEMQESRDEMLKKINKDLNKIRYR